MKPGIYINAFGVNCALGNNPAEVVGHLFAGDTRGIQPQSGWVPERTLLVGAVNAPLPTIDSRWCMHASRNNQVLLQAAQQIEAPVRTAIERFGADRVGIVLGTSTTGIAEYEKFLAATTNASTQQQRYYYTLQEQGSPAELLRQYWGLQGPAWVVSTACSSSGRALIAAKRLLDQNLCDAVISGGADTLCQLTLNGFFALEAISPQRCDPFSAQRKGINIGEGAGIFLLSKTPELSGEPNARLCGSGISMDAYHMSAPDPEGKGAALAMRRALQEAGLTPADIDYVNLHGTATRHNDAMEAVAMASVFPDGVACSSTKPLTGHALGAASAIEAALCLLTLSTDNAARQLPPHIWSGEADTTLPPLLLTTMGQNLTAGRGYAMSNSFAFGGNNVSLVFGRAQ